MSAEQVEMEEKEIKVTPLPLSTDPSERRFEIEKEIKERKRISEEGGSVITFVSQMAPYNFMSPGAPITSLQWLGGGNFSRVYEGKYQDKPVAVKEFTDFEAFEDSEYEAARLSVLNHPNIVKVYKVSAEDREQLLPYNLRLMPTSPSAIEIEYAKMNNILLWKEDYEVELMSNFLQNPDTETVYVEKKEEKIIYKYYARRTKIWEEAIIDAETWRQNHPETSFPSVIDQTWLAENKKLILAVISAKKHTCHVYRYFIKKIPGENLIAAGINGKILSEETIAYLDGISFNGQPDNKVKKILEEKNLQFHKETHLPFLVTEICTGGSLRAQIYTLRLAA